MTALQPKSVPGRGAVFFDRDGVLIEAVNLSGQPGAISTKEAIRYTRDAELVCAALRNRGVPLFIFTNQPDVGRGLVSRDAVDAVNRAIETKLGITATAVAYSGDDADPLRKPNPGMLHALASEYGVSLAHSVAIGDRWRDVEAGRRAGVATLFIDRGWRERQPVGPGHVVSELGDGLPWILSQLGLAS